MIHHGILVSSPGGTAENIPAGHCRAIPVLPAMSRRGVISGVAPARRVGADETGPAVAGPWPHGRDWQGATEERELTRLKPQDQARAAAGPAEELSRPSTPHILHSTRPETRLETTQRHRGGDMRDLAKHTFTTIWNALRDWLALWREFDSQSGVPGDVSWFSRAIRLLTAPTLMVLSRDLPRSTESWLVVLAFYATGSALCRAGGLATGLEAARDGAGNDPTTGRHGLAVQCAGHLFSSSLVIYDSFVVLWMLKGSPGVGLAVLFAVIHWLTCASVAVLSAACLEARLLHSIGRALFGLAVLSHFAVGPLIPHLPYHSECVLLAMPSGWVTYAFLHGGVHWILGKTWAYWFLIPPGLLVATVPFVFGRLRDGRGYAEGMGRSTARRRTWGSREAKNLFRAESSDGDSDRESQALFRATIEGPPRSPSHSDLHRATRSQPVERLAMRFLSTDGHALLRRLIPRKTRWTSAWLVSLAVTAVGVGLCFDPAPAPLLLHCIIGTAAIIIGLPVLGGHWPALWDFAPYVAHSGDRASGSTVDWQLWTVMVTVNLVRCGVWLPLGLAYASAFSFRMTGSLEAGVVLGVRFMVVVFCARPLIATFCIARLRTLAAGMTRSTTTLYCTLLLFSLFGDVVVSRICLDDLSRPALSRYDALLPVAFFLFQVFEGCVHILGHHGKKGGREE